jgi:hypothetical protein
VNGSGSFLPANYLLIPRGTNGSGAFLLATGLLVPCPTVCDPSGHVAIKTVAR